MTTKVGVWHMVRRTVAEETNGEKKLLWRFLETALAILGAAALLATAINAWVVKDYLAFKEVTARRWEWESRRDVQYEMAQAWEQAVLLALAKRLALDIPPPPGIVVPPKPDGR